MLWLQYFIRLDRWLMHLFWLNAANERTIKHTNQKGAMAILAQEKVGIWIGENMICAALEWATSGGQKREAVLLMNGQFHEKKFAAFEMAKKSGTATNDYLN